MLLFLLTLSFYLTALNFTCFKSSTQPLNVSYIHGTLMPPDGPESWPKNNSRHQWLVFYRINGMSPEGSGLVDRRGEKWWDLPCKPHKVLIKLNCKIILRVKCVLDRSLKFVKICLNFYT